MNNTDILSSMTEIPSRLFNAKIWANGNVRSFKFNSNFASTDYLIVPGFYTSINSANPVKSI
ncbi:MAG: hypothetical protein IPH28_23575 [Cytophagaceae bacterium]|nr:hypothetical protein [Cytophagaceae bacterium]